MFTTWDWIAAVWRFFWASLQPIGGVFGQALPALIIVGGAFVGYRGTTLAVGGLTSP